MIITPEVETVDNNSNMILLFWRTLQLVNIIIRGNFHFVGVNKINFIFEMW